MKKNAINQFLLFVTLFFCLIFSSCINSLIDDSEDNSLPPLTLDDSDYVTISGCISPEINNGRSAFPTVPDLMSGASFSYKIIVKSGEDTLVTKDNNSITSWDGLTYEVNVPKGNNRIIVIEIYDSDGAGNKKIIFSGTSASFNVDDSNPVNCINVEVKPITDNGVNGSISLKFYNGVTGKNLYVTTESETEVLNRKSITIENNRTSTWDVNTVPAGSHTVKFDFYENNVSDQLLFSCTQVINVYSGLTTNEWVKNGDESYIQEEGENAIVITDELIKSFQQTVFYVDMGYTDGDENGSYFKPYTELSDAINKIKSLSDDNITYKVLLKSDITVNGALPELFDHKIEIASVGNEKKEIKNCSKISPYATLGNITFKNLKFSETENLQIGNFISVAFEDCIVAPKVSFVNPSTKFHLKGNCSFTGGLDYTTNDITPIILDSVVKPAESGFVATVFVNDYFSDDLSRLFDSSEADEKVLKSLAYFCIEKEGTENIFINTGSGIELVPLTNIKFVADDNANTNGLGVAGADDSHNGSMEQPYATVKKAVESFSTSSETNRYIFIAGNIQETSTVTFPVSPKKWYIRGWHGVELDPSNPEIGKIDTITRETSNVGSMFSIDNSSSSSIEVNLYNLKIDGSDVTAGKFGTGSKVGAGIYFDGNNKLNLDNVWFTRCRADNTGCAICNMGSTTIKNCTFSNNTADGATICSEDALEITDSTFNNCFGGAIFIEPTCSNPKIKNCTFKDNTVTNGNGGAIYSLAALEITNSTFDNCKANVDKKENDIGFGGAIYSQAALEITGSTFNNCTVNGIRQYTSGYGGAIYTSGNNIKAEINNCSFSSNSAVKGGAIYSGCDLTIIDSTFNSCSADYGGGIYQYYKTIDIKCQTTSVDFYKCSCTNNGAAILFSGTDGSSITGTITGTSEYNCKIRNCTSSDNGGGIGIGNKGSLETNYLSISTCSSKNSGGGIWIEGNRGINVNLKNSNISSCKSTENNGGGVYIGNSNSLILDNSSILNCTVETAGKNGSGLYIAGGSVTMSGGSNVYTTSGTRKNDIYIKDGTTPIKIKLGYNSPSASATSPMLIGYGGTSEFRLFEKYDGTDFDDDAFIKCLAPFKLDADTEKNFYLIKDNASYGVNGELGHLVKYIYVSNTGNAGGDGSFTTPYATIKQAVNSISDTTSKVICVSGNITEDRVTDANPSISFPAGNTVRVVGIGDTHKVTTGEEENEYCIFKIPSTSTVIFENMDFDGIKFNYTGSDTSVEAESSVFKVETDGNLTLNSCKFTEIKNNVNKNSSGNTLNPYSSCINNFGEVSIINTTFGKTDVPTHAVGTNYSCGGSKVKGAFIYNSGTMDIKKCIFSYGYGGYIAGAGAIYNDGGNLTFAEATSLEDKTVFQYCYGNAAGAIYKNNGDVGATDTNCEMKECYKQKDASNSEKEIKLVRQTEG